MEMRNWREERPRAVRAREALTRLKPSTDVYKRSVGERLDEQAYDGREREKTDDDVLDAIAVELEG